MIGAPARDAQPAARRPLPPAPPTAQWFLTDSAAAQPSPDSSVRPAQPGRATTPPTLDRTSGQHPEGSVSVDVTQPQALSQRAEATSTNWRLIASGTPRAIMLSASVGLSPAPARPKRPATDQQDHGQYDDEQRGIHDDDSQRTKSHGLPCLEATNARRVPCELSVIGFRQGASSGRSKLRPLERPSHLLSPTAARGPSTG
jgi:hypothetical protein